MKRRCLGFLLVIFLYGAYVSTPAFAATIFEETFSSGLSGWQITADSGNTVTTELDAADPARNQLLKIYYSGAGFAGATRSLGNNFTGYVSFELYDYGQNATQGTLVYVANAANKYIGVGVNNNFSGTNLVYRINDQNIDSGIPRFATGGYHTITIFVSPSKGAWAEVDGISLYFKGRERSMTSATTAGLETPTWVSTPYNAYFDNVIAGTLATDQNLPTDVPVALPLNFQTSGNRQVADLSGTWNIKPASRPLVFSPASASFAPQNYPYQPISVPGYWRRTFSETVNYVEASYSNALQTLDNPYPYWHGSVWYAVRITPGQSLQGKNISFQFAAVAAKADVYINGQLVGSHTGMYDPFAFDIGQQLVYGQMNTIIMRITDSEQLEQPPTIGYGVYDHLAGGIWQPVKIVASYPVHITQVRSHTPSLDEANVGVDIKNSGSATTAVVRAEILNSAGQVLKSVSSSAFAINPGQNLTQNLALAQITGILPWSPESPQLYDLRVSILQNGNVIDQITKTIGFRTFSVSGNKFSLNGQEYFLRGVSIAAHGRTPNDPTFIHNFIARVKETGANAIRFSAYPASELWLDETDSTGLLVAYDLVANHQMSLSQAQAETANIIKNISTHPSLAIITLANENILFSPGNESLRTYYNGLANFLKTSVSPNHVYLTDAGCQSFNYVNLPPAPVSQYGGNFADICGTSDITDTHRYFMWYRYDPNNPLALKDANDPTFIPSTVSMFNTLLDNLFSYASTKPHTFSEFGGAYTDEQGNFWPSFPDGYWGLPVDSQQSLDAIGASPVRPTAALDYQSQVFTQTTQALLARRTNSRLAGIFIHGFDYALYNAFNIDWNSLQSWYVAAYSPPCRSNAPCITAGNWANHATLEPKPAFFALKQIYSALVPSPFPTPAATPRPTPSPSPSFTVAQLKTLLQNYLTNDDSPYFPGDNKANILDAGHVIRWIN